MMAMAKGDKGNRCSRLALVRHAGTTHRSCSTSISSLVASSTSTMRIPGSSCRRKASRNPVSDSHTRRISSSVKTRSRALLG